ncbi:Acrosin [Manis pentadactyla]|nr:Acrosin [Manis pentadactyla]
MLLISFRDIETDNIIKGDTTGDLDRAASVAWSSRSKHFVTIVDQNNKPVAVLVAIFWLKRKIINTKVTKTVSSNNLCYEEITAAESGG